MLIFEARPHEVVENIRGRKGERKREEIALNWSERGGRKRRYFERCGMKARGREREEKMWFKIIINALLGRSVCRTRLGRRDCNLHDLLCHCWRLMRQVGCVYIRTRGHLPLLQVGRVLWSKVYRTVQSSGGFTVSRNERMFRGLFSLLV